VLTGFFSDIGTFQALTMESTRFCTCCIATVIVFVPAIHLSADLLWPVAIKSLPSADRQQDG